MTKTLLTSWLFLFSLACAAGASEPVSYARVIADPELLERSEGLDAHAVHLARGDLARARAALGNDLVDRWLKARIDLLGGDAGAAHQELERIAHAAHLERAGLSANLLRHLDYDRAEAAFRNGDFEQLLRILDQAVGDHTDDALWQAHRARAQWATGQPSAADFAAALGEAGESLRRRPVFAWSALALRDEDDPEAAAERWLDHVEALRWPQELHAAIELFDATPDLAPLLDRDGLRERAIAFYARILRRDRGFELAERGAASADSLEAARCFVLAAEQLYRLRRHDELARWLKRSWPSALDDEGRASLAAYPWGVRRRAGASVEIAEGFDRVWQDFPKTRRGLEALWEAAWMYELSDFPLDAEQRFLEYARQEPAGPLASAAATRAIGLPARRGDDALVLERFDELQQTLRDTNDLATARWLAANAARRLDSAVGPLSSGDDARLRHDPLRTPPPHPWSAPHAAMQTPTEEVLQELLRLQALAFQRVAHHLGLDLGDPLEGPLAQAEELYELGLSLDGDYLLNAEAARGRREAATQLRAAWLAWRMGRAERQARVGFQLRLLLEDAGTRDLDLALERIAHPTPFARDLLASASEQDLPAGLLWAVMRRESFYDPAVISLAGAYGLLQLLPSTAAQMAGLLGDSTPDTDALRQPLWNLRYGSRYLRKLLDESDGDVYRALAAYNAGEANGERWAARREPEAPPESILFLISYSETRAYVYHVLRFWRLYADIFPSLGSFDGLGES